MDQGTVVRGTILWSFRRETEKIKSHHEEK
jgi:hypothetical protein